MGYNDINSIEQSSNSENSRNYGDIHGNSFFGVEKIAVDSIPNNPSVKTITSEANENPNICDAIAIDIGTSKCRISICKDKYIQIVEHESSRSVPSYVALSEQNEWLVGKMAENYAVCLQNVIYDIRWLLAKTNNQVEKASSEKRYLFKYANGHKDGLATFDIIEPNKSGPLIVNASQMFDKLLDTLFTTAYKNLQHSTTIAITIPIKSTQSYKNSVKNCVEDAMNYIVAAMPSSTAAPNIKLIDEPIAVAAAYAPRLNLHPEGDIALVFCMGAGYLQVAAYFIQQKAQQEKVSWTDLIITQMPEIEPIVETFAGDDIDRLIFEEMMKKLTRQNGGQRPKVSTRAGRRLKIACEKMKCALSFAPHTRIDVDSLYRSGDEDCDLVAVIQKDEIKGYYNEKVDQIVKKVGEAYKDLKPKFILLAGGSTRIPLISESLAGVFKNSTICNFLNVDEVAANGAAAIASRTVTVAEKSIDYNQVIGISKEETKELVPTPAARPTPADDTPILSKENVEGDQSLDNPDTFQDNRSEHSSSQFKRPQPVLPSDSSFDSPKKKPRSEKSNLDVVDDVQNKEAEALRDIQRNSSSQRLHEKDFTNYQSEQQCDIANTPIFEDAKFPYPAVHRPRRSCDGTTLSNLEKAPKSPESSNERDMLFLPPSDSLGINLYRETEKANPTRLQAQEQYSRPSSRITDQMKYRVERTNVIANVSQSQSLKNNAHSNSQPPAYLSYDRNMQSLSPSGVYTLRRTEGADPMKSKIQEQYSQSSSRITDQMKYREKLPYRFDNNVQSQGLKNNPYNNSQPPTYSSSSIKIGHNSRDQNPMPSASTVEYKQFDRKYANATSSNSMNIGNQYRQNRDNVVITSSKSKNNSSKNTDQRMHGGQSIKYYKWMRDSHGKNYIELELYQLTPGQSIYPIYPATLQGVLKVELFVPYKTFFSQGYDRYTLSSIKFYGIREVRVNLQHYSSKDRDNYECHITIVGVDYKDYEIKKSMSSLDRRPLNIWRKSYISLELI